MDAFKLLEIMPKYEICPNCGNDKIGNGYGKIRVDDDYFYRDCRCGWKVKVNEEGQEF